MRGGFFQRIEAGVSGPAHPLKRVLVPTLSAAGVAGGGYAAWQATDSKHGLTRQVLLPAGAGLATVAAFKGGNTLGLRGARYSDEAMYHLRTPGATYENFAWPKGTYRSQVPLPSGEKFTQDWITPHEGAGDALAAAGLLTGMSMLGFGIAGAMTHLEPRHSARTTPDR